MNRLVFVSCLLALVGAFPCPENFEPCTCTDDGNYNLIADCSLAKNDEELNTAFSTSFPFTNFASLTIDQLDCGDCELDTINQNTFGDVYFINVTITGTSVSTIEDGAFEKSQDSLEVLYLAQNKIGYFPFEVIPSYSVLNTLDLTANAFASDYIISDIYSNSLTDLYLDSNPDLNFDASLVKGCRALKTVTFEGNNLVTIPEFAQEPIGMFTGLAHIQNISFSNNALGYIRTDTIVGNQNTLVHVDLSSNAISLVEERFVRGKWARNPPPPQKCFHFL